MKIKRNLIIAGSPARILNSNYFDRKVDFYSKNYKVTLVMDSYVFHDKKENVLKLCKEEKIEKSICDENWEKFLETKVYDYSKIIKGFKLKKWNSIKSSKVFLNFIKSVNSKCLCIDIIKCPICNKRHVGPFKVDNEIVICNNEHIPVKELNCFNCRIKFGYLQFYLAKTMKTKVLINEKFYNKNIDLIKRLNLDKYIVIDTSKKRKIVLLNDYIQELFENVKIPYSKNHLTKLIKCIGLKNCFLVFKREKLRERKKYSEADEIRQILLKKDIKIEDGKNLSYLIIKRRKK